MVSSAKLFITGRPYIEPIVSRLLDPGLSLDIEADRADVRKLVAHKIDQDGNPELMDDNLKQEVMTAIPTATRECE
jgi:hypothetical protein